jgi:hypothetical protein
MTWWTAAAPWIASALGAGAQAYNTARTTNKQNQAAVEGYLRQKEFEDQARQRFKKQLDELQQSTPDDERRTLSSQIRQQLRTKQALALSGIQPTGGSQAVRMYAGEAEPVAVDYGDFIGNTMASIDAPLYQRQGEAYDRADVGNVINTMRRHSAAEDMLTRLRIAGIRPNPGLNMLAAALSAYGTSGAGMFNPTATSGGSVTGLPNLGGMSAQNFYGDPSQVGLPTQTMMNPWLMGQSGTGVGSILKYPGMFRMPGRGP